MERFPRRQIHRDLFLLFLFLPPLSRTFFSAIKIPEFLIFQYEFRRRRRRKINRKMKLRFNFSTTKFFQNRNERSTRERHRYLLCRMIYIHTRTNTILLFPNISPILKRYETINVKREIYRSTIY